MLKPNIIILQGPTGVGKTDAALALARDLPLEIINADSMQFYRHMDIGTSKPDPKQLRQVPHHLFSIINPDEPFNAARFMELGRTAVADIYGRGRMPLAVGGTGLYLRALTRGLVDAPDRDEQLRKELQQRDPQSLFAELQRVDPQTAQRVQPNDTVRIVRALEVFRLTGRPLSFFHQRHGFAGEHYRCLKLTLERERDELYRRIEARVEQMIAQGFEQEVRSLLGRGYAPELRPLQSIGYRQMVAVVRGRMSLDAAVHDIKKATKRLAKRQMTWFRHDDGAIRVVLPGQQDRIAALAKNFLNNQ